MKKRNCTNLKKRLEDTNKILDFLKIIRVEVEDITLQVEKNIPLFEQKDHFLIGNEYPFLMFDTSYWEIYKSSGEFPALFEPIVVQVFTHFYAVTQKCNILYEKFILSRISNNSLLALEFITELNKNLHTLKNIIESPGIDPLILELIEKTRNEKKDLTQQIAKLKKIEIPLNYSLHGLAHFSEIRALI